MKRLNRTKCQGQGKPSLKINICLHFVDRVRKIQEKNIVLVKTIIKQVIFDKKWKEKSIKSSITLKNGTVSERLSITV